MFRETLPYRNVANNASQWSLAHVLYELNHLDFSYICTGTAGVMSPTQGRCTHASFDSASVLKIAA